MESIKCIGRSCLCLIALAILFSGCAQDKWISLFDGETLDGWKASENKTSWQIIDGALVAKGPRSHLFYNGDVLNHDFKNFELSVDVKTEGNANAGIYFHTAYQEEGWPDKGFEFQVINDYVGPDRLPIWAVQIKGPMPLLQATRLAVSDKSTYFKRWQKIISRPSRNTNSKK